MPLIIMSDNIGILTAGVKEAADRKPLIYAATKENADAVAALAKEIEAFPSRMFQFEYMLKTLDELGYDSVEPQVATGQASSMLYGYDPTLSLESDPIEVKKLVASYGLDLICISAHANLMDVGEAGPSYLKKAIGYAKLVGELAQMIHQLDPEHPVAVCDGNKFKHLA
jgi:sugar phosphate isomerase/epimerase